MEKGMIVNRVLSIQSHVVCGYVGNKSACFPLQLLGFEVDFINSVQLSNHTGYKYFKGQRLNAEGLEELYEGLKQNNLHNYTHILTGYVGTVEFLKKLIDILTELKKINPSLYLVCDPVMGDNGKMYLPEGVLTIYKDILIPMADLITPNQFEAELLTGIKIESNEDAIRAMNIFHDQGVKTVVISSAELNKPDTLLLFASSIKDGEKKTITMSFPKLPAVFTGTGDLFTALLLAWMAKSNGNLKVSCENAINTIQSILSRTLKYAQDTSQNVVESPTFLLELKLIQSKEDIEKPPCLLKSVVI